MKQWLGEKEVMIDLILMGEIPTPMCPYDPKSSSMQSYTLAHHHAI